MDALEVERRRLIWVRAVRTSKLAKIAMARADIEEMKKRIEKIDAALDGFERDGRVAQCRVRRARRAYREEIISAGFDPMDIRFQDALSSDESSDNGASVSDNESNE